MINILLFSFFSTVYLACAGSLFFKYSEKEENQIYFSIFLGSSTLAFIGLFLNFFTALNIFVNSILFLFILVIGIFILFKKRKIIKLIYHSILIALISMLILSYDTVYRPDAYLYHLPLLKY